jgi:hypothetical protein
LKTKATRILETIASEISLIREGDRIPGFSPNSDIRFNSTVRTVLRTLSDVPLDRLPAVHIVEGDQNYRHVIADVLNVTLNIHIGGTLHSNGDGNGTPTATEMMRSLQDDLQTLITANPTWDGLAGATRITHSARDTDLAEPDAAFILSLEVDYVEAPPAEEDPVMLSRLPEDDTVSFKECILNGFYNALIQTPEIAFVQRSAAGINPADVARKQTPGIFFFASDENYQYHGSTDTSKRISLSLILVAVEIDPLKYIASIDLWETRVKNVLGNNADLGGKVLTIDVNSIRTSRSEFPVVFVEADVQLLYVQSFLLA